MSITTTLVLTAIGGIYFKTDDNQIYMKDRSITDKVNSTSNHKSVYSREFERLKERTISLFQNFFVDLIKNKPFLYPLKGIREFFKHSKVYSHVSLLSVLWYLLSFAIITVLYWATLTPSYFGLFMGLGPIGVALASLHSILHCNMLVMMFMRFTQQKNDIITDCIHQYNFTTFKQQQPIKYYFPKSSKEFWFFHLPKQTAKYLVGSCVLLTLFNISFIPIIGPVTFNLIVSPVIGKIYFSKLLRLQGYSNIQRDDLFFKHLGFYTSFGITIALLESIPIVSGFVITTNTIGTAMWLIEN